MSMMYANLPPGLLQYLFIHIMEHIFPKYKTESQALQSYHWWLGLYQGRTICSAVFRISWTIHFMELKKKMMQSFQSWSEWSPDSTCSRILMNMNCLVLLQKPFSCQLTLKSLERKTRRLAYLTRQTPYYWSLHLHYITPHTSLLLGTLLWSSCCPFSCVRQEFSSAAGILW